MARVACAKAIPRSACIIGRRPPMKRRSTPRGFAEMLSRLQTNAKQARRTTSSGASTASSAPRARKLTSPCARRRTASTPSTTPCEMARDETRHGRALECWVLLQSKIKPPKSSDFREEAEIASLFLRRGKCGVQIYVKHFLGGWHRTGRCATAESATLPVGYAFDCLCSEKLECCGMRAHRDNGRRGMEI